MEVLSFVIYLCLLKWALYHDFKDGYLMHVASYLVQARLDRPIAAHVNICPGGLQEGKDGAANLVRSESCTRQPILFRSETSSTS